jgi:hypothetical protein
MLLSRRKVRRLGVDREETGDAPRVASRIVSDRPGHILVADP